MYPSRYHRVFWALVHRLSFYTGLRFFSWNNLVTRGFPLGFGGILFLIAALPGPAGETGFGKKGPGHGLFNRAGRRLGFRNFESPSSGGAGQARKADERRQVGCFFDALSFGQRGKN